VVHTNGETLVVVQRDDLDLSEPNGIARRLAYYDNRVGHLDLEWNAEELLHDLNAGMDFSLLWSQDELNSVLANIRSPDFAPASLEEQGRLDQLADKSVECPECGHRFTP
jgi:hypothetical protein